jgi:hypothetical protein
MSHAFYVMASYIATFAVTVEQLEAAGIRRRSARTEDAG